MRWGMQESLLLLNPLSLSFFLLLPPLRVNRNEEKGSNSESINWGRRIKTLKDVIWFTELNCLIISFSIHSRLCHLHTLPPSQMLSMLTWKLIRLFVPVFLNQSFNWEREREGREGCSATSCLWHFSSSLFSLLSSFLKHDKNNEGWERETNCNGCYFKSNYHPREDLIDNMTLHSLSASRSTISLLNRLPSVICIWKWRRRGMSRRWWLFWCNEWDELMIFLIEFERRHPKYYSLLLNRLRHEVLLLTLKRRGEKVSPF